MEQLKTLDEIFGQDSRMQMVWVDRATGEQTPFSLADHRLSIANESLAGNVPEAIRDHFATAQNLLLYSWFVYRFLPVAEMHLYSCLEFALRDRLGLDNEENPPSLRRLLRRAKEGRVFDGATFRDRHMANGAPLRHGDPGMSDADWFMWLMADYIARSRNDLAHGSITLMPDGGRALRIVRDAISHLYAESAGLVD